MLSCAQGAGAMHDEAIVLKAVMAYEDYRDHMVYKWEESSEESY